MLKPCAVVGSLNLVDISVWPTKFAYWSTLLVLPDVNVESPESGSLIWYLIVIVTPVP